MMEDIRTYRLAVDEDEDWSLPDDERDSSASLDEEVPFHIPRD
jgi:hypothetical protein